MGKLCVSCMHKEEQFELKTETESNKRDQAATYAAINLAEGYTNYPS